MGTVRDICWSSKYRKQFQSKPKEEEPKSTGSSKPSVKTGKNFKSALKIKQKKQDSCYSLTKKLVDSLQLLEKGLTPKEGTTSQISLCLKPCSKLIIEDFSAVKEPCCPADDCETNDITFINKMCRNKKPQSVKESTGKDDCSGKDSPCPPPKEKPKCCENPKCCVPEKTPKRSSTPKKEKREKGKCCLIPQFDCCEEPRPKRKKVKGKKTKSNTSMSVMNESARANCCACCCLLAEYFQEILRLFCNKNDTRLSEIFCELCDVAGCICNDCLNFLRKLIGCICSMTKCC